ncbi:MAG: TonB-dependent receptor [Agarilytica sp.]
MRLAFSFLVFQFSLLFTCNVVADQPQSSALATTSQESSKPDKNEAEEVYVTGSRIRQQKPQAHLPALSISKADLESSGQILLADSLNRLSVSGAPLTSQATTNFGLFSPGLASIDLRNLSPNRTLVLIDGKRVVGGDSERPNVVDLNSIPTALIERVDIVTGGVSAIYGSEAVAGVVNIITKKSFDAYQLNVQTGVSAEGDGEENRISLSGGISAFSEKFQSVYNLSYSDVAKVRSADRDFSQNDEFLGDFQDYSVFAPQGALWTDFGLLTEAADGTWLKDFNAAEDGFNRADYRLLQVPIERYSLTLNNTLAFNEDLSLGVDTSFIHTESQSQIEPVVAGFVIGVGEFPMYLPDNNPFIPSDILSLYDDAELSLPGFFDFTRRFSEIGPTIANQERNTSRIVVDLSGSFDGFRWDSYFQLGKSKREQSTQGNYNTLRFQNALDVEADPDSAGAFRCIDAQARADGCVPINLFGENSISQAAVDYVGIGAQDSSEITQKVFVSEIEGLGAALTDAGQVQFAGGFEWRKESFKSKADDFALSGYSSSNVFSEINGEFSVTEVFAEVSVPLLADTAAVDYFGVNLATRYSDYDTVGHTNSWQAGIDWQINSQVGIRVNYSKAMRAPNIVELFDPGAQTFFEFIDPCVNGGEDGNTADNCADQGVPDDFDPGDFGSFALGVLSGNEILQEETAYTFTAGVTVLPLENLSLSLDFFDIEIEDAIELIDPQFKLNQCYASSAFSSSDFCSGIARAGSDFGFVITQLDLSLQNLGVMRTRGFDLALNGSNAFLSGELAYDFHYTRTTERKSEVNGGVIDQLGEPGFQKDKAHSQVSYTLGAFTTRWASRYLGSGVVDNEFDTVTWPENNDLPAYWYHDLSFHYTLALEREVGVYFGVNNVEDKQPPYIPSPSSNNIPGSNTAAGVYDVVGRYFYMGVKASF